MATDHIITSELPNFQNLDEWAKENLSKEEFNEFETHTRKGNLELISHIYENWIVDQKITHQYVDIYGTPVTVSHTTLNKI